MVVGDVTTAVDVLVLGAGPGGYVAAIRAAQLGRHVTLVDARPPGGTCLHQGCIPLKALLSSSERYQQIHQEELAAMGIHAENVSFDWPGMQAWKQSVVDRLADGVRRLVAGNRVDYVHGTGWFMNAQEVRVEGEHGSHRFKFDHGIIATGAAAVPVPDLPYDGKNVLAPEQALLLPELPAALSIVGNDYIALELATMVARLGAGKHCHEAGESCCRGALGGARPVCAAGDAARRSHHSRTCHGWLFSRRSCARGLQRHLGPFPPGSEWARPDNGDRQRHRLSGGKCR